LPRITMPVSRIGAALGDRSDPLPNRRIPP